MSNYRPVAMAFLLGLSGTHAQAEIALSERTINALIHVVAHEIGHAFLREFDIPILGPEESIADDFATVYVHLTFPDRAEAIVSARADQNLADGQDVGVFSEYADDDQRAGRSICLLFGLDPKKYANLPQRYGLTPGEAAECKDFGPEVGRSWRRLLDEHRMPESAPVTEVKMMGAEIPLAHALAESDFADAARTLLSAIDWHSQITLAIADCDGDTGWSRNGRVISLCDSYVERFARQLGQ